MSAPASAMHERMLRVLITLAEGEVVSYGDVAETAGYPRRSRAVGHLLATTDAEVPWWRVVRADGHLATVPPREQAALLRAEGVTVRGDRVIESPAGRFRP